MGIPLEAYKSLLIEETIAIGSQERETEFEAIHAIVPQDTSAPQAFPVSFTNVHMIPGETSPRLRRVEQRNPGVPPGIAAVAIDHCVGYISATMGPPQYGGIRMDAQAIEQACEDIDQEAASALGAPFKTLAVLAVYITSAGEPFATEFSSRSFAEVLVDYIPQPDVDLSEPEEIPEEIFRLAYDLAVEHGKPGPYEQWRETNIENMKGARDFLGGTERARALGAMEYLFIPSPLADPIINKLFE
jgi:hypothetical protein